MRESAVGFGCHPHPSAPASLRTATSPFRRRKKRGRLCDPHRPIAIPGAWSLASATRCLYSGIVPAWARSRMPFLSFNHQRSFADLSDREVLALAIQNEEEYGRIYRDFADRLRADFPASAAIFSEMAEEENTHRQMLFDIYRQRFGEHIPLIRRDDV